MQTTDVIQADGRITLPAEWREKYGIKQGDSVSFIETDHGLLVLPREAAAMALLDQLGGNLRAQHLTLDEMIESGREIRQQIYDEKYA